MQIQELIFFVSSSPAMYTVDFIKQYEYLVDRCFIYSKNSGLSIQFISNRCGSYLLDKF
jgi:hypothetical protein